MENKYYWAIYLKDGEAVKDKKGNFLETGNIQYKLFQTKRVKETFITGMWWWKKEVEEIEWVKVRTIAIIPVGNILKAEMKKAT